MALGSPTALMATVIDTSLLPAADGTPSTETTREQPPEQVAVLLRARCQLAVEKALHSDEDVPRNQRLVQATELLAGATPSHGADVEGVAKETRELTHADQPADVTTETATIELNPK